MKRHPALRAGRCLLAAALPLLLASKCFFGFSSDDEAPTGPPAEAWVWIDSPPAKVDTASAFLEGEAECPDCFASDWQYGSCPVLACPDAPGDVGWTNHATGATGAATHGVVSACHCPLFSYGYCYSACNHVWWATVPLTYGDNGVEVFATAPGYATGSASTLIQRVPVAPEWLPAETGAGQVTLTWTAVAGATSYNLYWSTTPYVWASLCTKIAGVASPYVHDGLASGVEHYYFVTALAGEAESFDSLRLAATPQ